jgi:hypothetical protein
MTDEHVDSRDSASQLGHTAVANLIRRYGTHLQRSSGGDGRNAARPPTDDAARAVRPDPHADEEATGQ